MKSIDDLLGILRDLTYEDKLRWEDDDALTNSFQAELPKYHVRIFEWTDEDDGTSGLTAQLFTGNGFGNVVDSSTANQFSSRYPTLLEVYIAARRSARNVSETIESLEEELKKLKKK